MLLPPRLDHRSRGEIYQCQDPECGKWWVRQADGPYAEEILKQHFETCVDCHCLDSPVTLKRAVAPPQFPDYLL